MHISKIMVKNFRLLKEFTFDLEEALSLVIGKNNCGKTSLLSILSKFIGNKLSTNSFAWEDFSIAFQGELNALVERKTLTESEEKTFPIGISLNIFIEYGETDDLSNISSMMMDLNPDNNIVVIEFQYSISVDSLKELIKDFADYTQKLLRKRTEHDQGNEGISNSTDFSDFMKSEFKKYFRIGTYSRGYDVQAKKANDQRVPIESDKIIEKIISFKSINARRTVSNSETNNSLSILSSEYYKNIEENENQKQAIDEFKDVIGKTDKDLDKIYSNLFSGVIDKVKKFGGIKEGDSIIKIISSLQQRELLKGNTTVMYDHGNSSLLPESYNGLGYLNLIGMIFEIDVIMAEFRKDGKENERPADINLFFIEEPEAHTHPQMQYVFINNIKDILSAGCLDTKGNKLIEMQSIITTHSSHIVAESNFEDIKYFYISDDKYVYAKNLKDLEVEYKQDGDEGVQRFKFLKQYLTLNRSELFFADKAIFIEGDTERILLPAMMKKIDQQMCEGVMPLLSQNISIVEVGAYSHIFDKFIDFIGIKSLIITDIDPAKIQPVMDDDGKPMLNKDLTPKIVTSGCRADEATTSTNAALKFYYSSYIGVEKTDQLSAEEKNVSNVFSSLSSLTFEQKSLAKDKSTANWISSDNGKVKIIFQHKESDSNGIRYQACSFEDAFIHLNRQFIKDNLVVFKSLKHTKYLSDAKKDAWDLALCCIDKKTSFAMEILLASNFNEDGHAYCNWDIPEYIKEGLEWLKAN